MVSTGIRVCPTSFSSWLTSVEVLDCHGRRLKAEVEVEGFDPVKRSGEGEAQRDRRRPVAGERSRDKDDRLGHRQLRATGKNSERNASALVERGLSTRRLRACPGRLLGAFRAFVMLPGCGVARPDQCVPDLSGCQALRASPPG